MQSTPQNRATQNYRRRLNERGVCRFEVMGLDRDRELIRSLAKRLAADDAEATRIRETVTRTIGSGSGRKGGIYEALRRSPLVGADLDFERVRGPDREIDL
ncbi:MAG TPA: hypothetical protein VHW66_08590 [Stellaceae bacterium]|jgi:hypothetical protein|nr:hypothetical protein [Stellaceae bacterium]